MAKPFDSIIDAFLSDREPNWKELGLADAKKSGEEALDRTGEYVDKDFMDEIAESASRHTAIPPSKTSTLKNRMYEKEKAAPQINAVQADWHKSAVRSEDYRSKHGDNDSLLDEVTMSIEKAEGSANFAENSVAKKEISEGQVQKYIRDLLNQGTSPAKVAQQLEKLAEIELFNKGMATDYLQRNAGMLGLAYLEPNTFMDKESPSYQHTASDDSPHCTKCDSLMKQSGGQYVCEQCGHVRELGARALPKSSNACVRSYEGMKNAGIKPTARSVKQINACQECTFFKKDAAGKHCNLYHLPVVANVEELSQIVNNLTPGVPQKNKRAALVQIANGDGKRAQASASHVCDNTIIVKTADAHVNNQTARHAPTHHTFTATHVAKLHDKGVGLSDVYKWADKKFGSVETSVAFRGFAQSFRKNERGRIVVAAADLQFLNSIGIRSEKFEGGAKCGSCPTHFGREARPVETERGALRVDGKFAQRTASAVRTGTQKEVAPVIITAEKIRALHQAGHSLEKIYKGAAAKIGTLEAKKAVAGYVASLKKQPGRIVVNASDRSFLMGKLSFRPEALNTLESVRRPVDQVVASSGSSPILDYPGKSKQASDRLPHDGMSILNEYDLTNPVVQQDIDTDGPQRLEVESGNTFKVDLE